jgi:hypothetical protein
MSIKTPLTARALRNHFTYGSWKYLLLVVAAVFGWNLIYTTTQYRPPDEKKIDFYVASSSVDSDTLKTWLESVRLSDFPDMELIEPYVILEGNDDYAAQMQLSTYVMAGEGDVYLLEADRFKNFAAQGAMLPLDNYVTDGTIDTQGIDLGAGYVTLEETGERALLGIPADNLFGLINHFNVDCRGRVLCVTVRSGNELNAVKFVDYLLKHMQEPAPDWLTAPVQQP